MTKNSIALLLAAVAVAIPLIAASLQRELDARPGQTLEVNLRGGSIEISGWDRSRVAIEAETGEGREAELEIRTTAEGVSISDPRGAGHGKRRVRVRVPRRFDLQLDTMGGSIAIRDVEGSLRGSTLGGSLELANLSGRLAMRTHGGNIALRDSNVDGSVTTMGGRVLIENVVGDVEGTSMGGNVEYRNVTRRDGSGTGKAVTITTMGGEVVVASAPDGADLRTMGGNIRVGSARGFVKARTMGGAITIDAVDGWVEATTMGGDLAVTMIGDASRGDRHVLLDSKGGDIELTLPANLEMDVDVEIAYTKSSSRRYEIRSEFPIAITTTPEWDRSNGDPRRIIRGRGKTGSGRNKVTVRTINGDVYLKRR